MISSKYTTDPEEKDKTKKLISNDSMAIVEALDELSRRIRRL